MFYAAIATSLIALFIQTQASAWHRGLMAIAKSNFPYADASTRRQVRDELSFITPRFVSSRSGISGILMLVSAVLAGFWTGTWWIGIAWFIGLCIAANLFSRLFFPSSDAPYWGVQVLLDTGNKMRGAIMSGDMPLARRHRDVMIGVRDSLGLEYEDVLGNALREIGKKFPDLGVRSRAGE